MSKPRRAAPSAPRVHPTDCWYAVASVGAVGRSLTALRALDMALVLYRCDDGSVVALEDCCAHRAYPLSAGRLDGDTVVCGFCGFVYGPDGRCLSVPTQSRVPVGATVRSFPVRVQSGVVWVWFGEPAIARLHRLPELPWLADEGWATVSGQEYVEANFLLLHESFADVTQVPVIAPELSPLVLRAAPPPLDVVVSETTVSLTRDFPPGRLPAWQAAAVGRPVETEYAHRQESHFLSPAVWVDHWDVLVPDSPEQAYRLRFTQLVMPVDVGASRLFWRVSRDFAVDDAATTGSLLDLFSSYYHKVAEVLGVMQAVLDAGGPRREVNVSADVAALKVRGIVQGMVSRDTLGANRQPVRKRSTR